MIKKMIKNNSKKYGLLDNRRSCLTKKEIKKFKAEAEDMKKQFRETSKFNLGI